MPTTTSAAITMPTIRPPGRKGQGSTRPGYAIVRGRGRPVHHRRAVPAPPAVRYTHPRVAKAQPTTTTATGSQT